MKHAHKHTQTNIKYTDVILNSQRDMQPDLQKKQEVGVKDMRTFDGG